MQCEVVTSFRATISDGCSPPLPPPSPPSPPPDSQLLQHPALPSSTQRCQAAPSAAKQVTAHPAHHLPRPPPSLLPLIQQRAAKTTDTTSATPLYLLITTAVWFTFIQSVARETPRPSPCSAKLPRLLRRRRHKRQPKSGCILQLLPRVGETVKERLFHFVSL